MTQLPTIDEIKTKINNEWIDNTFDHYWERNPFNSKQVSLPEDHCERVRMWLSMVPSRECRLDPEEFFAPGDWKYWQDMEKIIERKNQSPIDIALHCLKQGNRPFADSFNECLDIVHAMPDPNPELTEAAPLAEHRHPRGRPRTKPVVVYGEDVETAQYNWEMARKRRDEFEKDLKQEYNEFQARYARKKAELEEMSKYAELCRQDWFKARAEARGA